MGSQLHRNRGDKTVNLSKDLATLREQLRAMKDAEHEAARVLAMDRALGWGVLRSKTLRETLDRSVEAMVRELDAALARIWILDEHEDILVLQASAGLYTHLTGAHGRIPVGSLKIGLIAQERQPHLTNAVVGDPRVPDQEWAKREQLVSFAGYPLLVGDHLIGVVAMFARRPLSDLVLQGLASVAGLIAHAVERVRAEESLRESETQFRTLADAIPQLCWMANADGWIFWYNRRCYEYSGATAEQLKGWGWQSVHDPEFLPQVLERWRHSIASGEPFEMVLPLRGADGVFRPFLTRAVPVRDQDGNVARWFCTHTDISEQSDALRKSHEKEQARATELQAIMEAMPVSLFISRDPECRNIIGNRRTYELLRLPPGSNLSMSAREDERPATVRFLKHGNDIPAAELPLQKAAATGQAVHNLELELALSDGTLLNMIGNAVPFMDAEGRSHGSVGIFADITERKQTEERLRQVQKLESIGLLAGGIAHDFNNLLTVIMGGADSALNKYPSCEEIQQILTASERAAHLTSQLLAYAGKGQFFPVAINLSDLVSLSQQLLSASIPKRVDLVFNLSNKEPLIKADPNQIEQILMNLVINGAEAIPLNAEGRIEITTHDCDVTPAIVREHASEFDAQPGRFACLEVTDNGSGMDEATLARIFDPFFSTKFTGRGLGLAAAQGIVRSCRGFIEVHSSPGAGSTFRVFLPAAAAQPASGIPAGISADASQPREGRRAAVLVVDDEEMVRKLACAALREQGYEVLEAKNGRDALDVLACASSLPSLVLLDWTMPVMGGEELVPVLNRDYPGLGIIVTSGYPEEQARRGFPQTAAVGFLQKPYTVKGLVKQVDEALKSGAEPSTFSGTG